MFNYRRLWADWLTKHENRQQNMRIREKISMNEGVFDLVQKLDSVGKPGSREIRPNHRSVTGLITPSKDHPQIPFESSLERDFVILISSRPRVLSIESQPITLRFLDDTERERSYTPDFLISMNEDPLTGREQYTSTMLVEIKYKEELERPKPTLLQKFKYAKHWCEFRNFNFAVYTEEEIRTPELDRARFLMPHKFREQDIYLETQILEFMEEKQPLPIRNILQQDYHRYPSSEPSEDLNYAPEEVYAEVLRLLANNNFLSNPMEMVSEKTKVWNRTFKGKKHE